MLFLQEANLVQKQLQDFVLSLNFLKHFEIPKLFLESGKKKLIHEKKEKNIIFNII